MGRSIKKRIALQTDGKRGGARTIIAYAIREKVFFLYAYPKNKKDNVTTKELKALKLLGSQLMKMEENSLKIAVESGELLEVVENG